MLNGLHLYSAFIQSAVQSMPLNNLCLSFTRSHTHSHTNSCHARYRPARQEQSGVRRLAQGHAQGGTEPATLRLPDDCSYLLSRIALTCAVTTDTLLYIRAELSTNPPRAALSPSYYLGKGQTARAEL